MWALWLTLPLPDDRDCICSVSQGHELPPCLQKHLRRGDQKTNCEGSKKGNRRPSWAWFQAAKRPPNLSRVFTLIQFALLQDHSWVEPLKHSLRIGKSRRVTIWIFAFIFSGWSCCDSITSTDGYNTSENDEIQRTRINLYTHN